MDLPDLLRQVAVAMDALYPGIRNVRVVGDTIDGQAAVLPAPQGRWVPHAESRPRPAQGSAAAGDETGLSEKEAAIVSAIRTARGPLTTEEIAASDLVDLSPDNGTFKRRLRSLVERGVLITREGGGYDLAPENPVPPPVPSGAAGAGTERHNAAQSS